MNTIEAKILSIISEERYNLHGKEFVKVNLIIDLWGTEKTRNKNCFTAHLGKRKRTRFYYGLKKNKK